MSNKLIEIIVITLAVIGAIAVFGFLAMGIMMYWMMGY